MNIQFNIDWHGHLDISQYVREAEPKQRNADVRSAIYGRTDENNIELYLADCIYTARHADHILHVRRSGYYPDVEISASYLF